MESDDTISDDDLPEIVITVSDDATVFPDGPQTETYEFVKEMRSQFREGEKSLRDGLMQKIEAMQRDLFGPANKAIERFYALAKDGDRYDFSKLSGVQLEEAILTIQRTLYYSADEVAKLYSDAYLMSRIQEDEYWENYQKPVGGTKDDIRAFALRESRDSRYHYYYRYCIWRYLSGKMDALKELLKTMEFFRSRAIKDRLFG